MIQTLTCTFLTNLLAPAIVIIGEGEGALIRAFFVEGLTGEHGPFHDFWRSSKTSADQVEAVPPVAWAAGITGAVTRVSDSKESTSFSSRDSWPFC